MAVPVLFYRGPKSSYDASQHGNGIYFCTDTYEIFMNNHSYGGGKVQDVTLNSTNTLYWWRYYWCSFSESVRSIRRFDV